MKIAEVVTDLRVMWLGKDNLLKFRRYRPPLRVPILGEVKVGSVEEAAYPDIETLPGYYVYDSTGQLRRLNELGE